MNPSQTQWYAPPSGLPPSVGSSPVSSISSPTNAMSFKLLVTTRRFTNRNLSRRQLPFLNFWVLKRTLSEPPIQHLPSLWTTSLLWPILLPLPSKMIVSATFGISPSSRRMIFTLDFPDEELLVFKYTENKALLGHVTDTECRPDITVAFSSDWTVKGIMQTRRRTRVQRKDQMPAGAQCELLLALPPVGAT